MNKPEHIVPEFTTCVELSDVVPEEFLEDTVFIWEMQNDEDWWEVVLRSEATGEPAYAAPTLEEFIRFRRHIADVPSSSSVLLERTEKHRNKTYVDAMVKDFIYKRKEHLKQITKGDSESAED